MPISVNSTVSTSPCFAVGKSPGARCTASTVVSGRSSRRNPRRPARRRRTRGRSCSWRSCGCSVSMQAHGRRFAGRVGVKAARVAGDFPMRAPNLRGPASGAGCACTASRRLDAGEGEAMAWNGKTGGIAVGRAGAAARGRSSHAEAEDPAVARPAQTRLCRGRAADGTRILVDRLAARSKQAEGRAQRLDEGHRAEHRAASVVRKRAFALGEFQRRCKAELRQYGADLEIAASRRRHADAGVQRATRRTTTQWCCARCCCTGNEARGCAASAFIVLNPAIGLRTAYEGLTAPRLSRPFPRWKGQAMRKRTLGLCLMLATFAAAAAGVENKWRLQFSGNAESAGRIVLDAFALGRRADPAPARTSRRGWARTTWRSRCAARCRRRPANATASKVDDGEDVLVKKHHGERDFIVTVVEKQRAGREDRRRRRVIAPARLLPASRRAVPRSCARRKLPETGGGPWRDMRNGSSCGNRLRMLVWGGAAGLLVLPAIADAPGRRRRGLERDRFHRLRLDARRRLRPVRTGDADERRRPLSRGGGRRGRDRIPHGVGQPRGRHDRERGQSVQSGLRRRARAVAVVGAAFARLRAPGMARAMLAAGIAQALVVAAAFAVGGDTRGAATNALFVAPAAFVGAVPACVAMSGRGHGAGC